MDSLGRTLMVEYEARQRQAEVIAAAERRARLGELPQAPPLRERLADLLLALAHRLAPERGTPEIRPAARHLAHN